MPFLNIEEVERPDGIKLECINKPAAVGIVLFNEDFSKIMMVKQFRAGSKKEIYEIPAGIIDENETPMQAMYRETREETGYDDIIDIVCLGEFEVSPGYTSEKMHIYRARIRPESKQLELKLDENESLNCEWFDINEVEKLTGDMKTILGLQKALAIPKAKIGLYGGTFNPVTYLHLLNVNRAIEELNLDVCIIEPVGDQYEKKDMISIKQRMDMLQLAIKNNNKVILGTYEQTCFIQPNTIETLDKYKRDYGWAELYFICGSDNLKSMCGPNSWGSYEDIVERHHVICIQRDNDNVYQDIILKNQTLLKNKNNIHIIYENVINNVSSSAIRNLVKSGMNIKYLLPDAVEKYIKDNNLYK